MSGCKRDVICVFIKVISKVCVVSHGHNINKIINNINTLRKNIDFTVEENHNKINYSDLALTKK